MEDASGTSFSRSGEVRSHSTERRHKSNKPAVGVSVTGVTAIEGIS